MASVARARSTSNCCASAGCNYHGETERALVSGPASAPPPAQPTACLAHTTGTHNLHPERAPSARYGLPGSQPTSAQTVTTHLHPECALALTSNDCRPSLSGDDVEAEEDGSFTDSWKLELTKGGFLALDVVGFTLGEYFVST